MTRSDSLRTERTRDHGRLLAVLVELSAAQDLDAVVEIIRDRARDLIGADGITVVLRDGDQVFYRDENAIGPLWKGRRFPLRACISGWAIEHRQAVAIEDVYADERVPCEAYSPTFVKSLAMAPIRTHDPIGAIGAYWATRRRATSAELEVLQALADAAALAVRNAELWAERDRAQRSLESREAQLRVVTDAVPALISFIDPDGRYRFVNRAHETWFGQRREAIVGQRLRDVLGERAYDVVRPKLERALGGEEVTFEARLPHRTGGERWIEATYTPDRRSDGSIQGVVALVHDISERKGAEERLAASERRLRTLIEHTPTPVAMLDRHMRYLAVSRRWSSDFRLQDADLIGKSHHEVFPELPERWREVHRRCLAGAVERRDEEAFPRADGTVDWLKWEVRPWHDDQGEIGGIVIYSENITHVKAALDALRERDAHLRALADNIPQLAWMADEKGWIFWYNKRWFEYTGTTLETMQGWGWKQVHHPEHIDRVVAKWARALEEGRGWEDTFPLRGADGAYRWFLSRAIPIHDEQGRPVRWFGTNTDVTREQEAIHARDVFLSIASHELKTPLMPLTLQIQGIERMIEKEGVVDAAKVVTKLRKADKQVAHLQRLVNNLLDVSRLVENRLELDVEEVDLGKLAQETVDRMRPELEEASTPISVRAPSGVVGRWDRVRLEQVLTNLLSNALKYGRGKPVAVEVAQDDREAVLAVRDEGIGISPEDQQRVFGRFERAVSVKHYGGFGLGLWISRQVVEGMGGTIEVESALGQGSTFTVRLPRAAAARPTT